MKRLQALGLHRALLEAPLLDLDADLESGVSETTETKESPKDEPPEKDGNEWHYFDPHRDSVDSLIGELEEHCDSEAKRWDDEFGRLIGQWAEGLGWLRLTVGLDFGRNSKSLDRFSLNDRSEVRRGQRRHRT
jgi:hypothetical protein